MRGPPYRVRKLEAERNALLAENKRLNDVLSQVDQSTRRIEGNVDTILEQVAKTQTLVSELRFRAENAEKQAENWKREYEMFRDAWMREIHGSLIPKTHLIDSLVLTTREIYNGYLECKKATK